MNWSAVIEYFAYLLVATAVVLGFFGVLDAAFSLPDKDDKLHPFEVFCLTDCGWEGTSSGDRRECPNCAGWIQRKDAN